MSDAGLSGAEMSGAPVHENAGGGGGAGEAGLRVTGLVKSYGAVRALLGVSLDFPAGTVTALMGENGAGKSTLLKIVCGDQGADSGTVGLDGVPLRLHSPADARAAGIRLIRRSRRSSRTSASPRTSTSAPCRPGPGAASTAPACAAASKRTCCGSASPRSSTPTPSAPISPRRSASWWRSCGR